MKQRLTVIMPGNVASARFTLMLAEALKGVPAHIQTTLEAPLEQERLLFAIPLDESGVNHEYYSLLAYLRTHPGCLNGSVGGVVVDGPGTLYTKSVARDLVLAASLAGCTFPGRSLVEAIGSLQNFKIQAKNAGCDLMMAYRLAAFNLVNRVMTFTAPHFKRPHLLVLHASSRSTSNTLDLWGRVRADLEPPVTSRRSACATARWRTAPAVPTPPVSISASRASASTAALWCRMSTPPCGMPMQWCCCAPTITTPSPPISPPPSTA